MGKYGNIACVTGASGMIGSSIARKLIDKNFEVRVLTRSYSSNIPGTELFVGELNDGEVISSFLKGADFLFHCAAELKDESKMWEVNVLGTEWLLKYVQESDVKYFCFISSVGVTGLTDHLMVDEQTKCNPQNTYEYTKLAAEKLVSDWIDHCNVVILRPTNVIDDQRPGVLALPIRNNWFDRLEVFIKGGEYAHIIHADDVADAAIYFTNVKEKKHECYIVSIDHDNRNTYAGLWRLYNQYSHKKFTNNIPLVHVPTIIPYIMRLLKYGKRNKSNINYSSEKLVSIGFQFQLGLEGAVKRISSYWNNVSQ